MSIQHFNIDAGDPRILPVFCAPMPPFAPTRDLFIDIDFEFCDLTGDKNQSAREAISSCECGVFGSGTE
jgi:hypothetical protein